MSRCHAWAALLLIGALLVPGSQAEEHLADLEYVVVAGDDSGDGVGFWDILEIALAEPGDGTVVFRITSGDAPPIDAAGSIEVFFDAPAGSFRSGVSTAGEPSSTNSFDGCEMADAGLAYCWFEYASLDVEPGDVLTGFYAISYLGPAQDRAPGGTYAECFAAGDCVGEDHTVTGGPNDEDAEDATDGNATDSNATNGTDGEGTADGDGAAGNDDSASDVSEANSTDDGTPDPAQGADGTGAVDSTASSGFSTGYLLASIGGLLAVGLLGVFALVGRWRA